MNRVTGIGGLFFKCDDADAMKAWYQKHLGIQSDQYGGCFHWYDKQGNKGHTVWSTFTRTTEYFKPSVKDFMFNYRVEDLEGLLNVLKEEGIDQIGETEVFEYGKFAWIMDPEGNKIELWQAPPNFEDFTAISQESK